MIVCLCHRISDRDIERQVRDGVGSFDALQDETCIARNCGCCEDAAREIFHGAQGGRVITLHRAVPVAVPA